jgi:hypothetical protein
MKNHKTLTITQASNIYDITRQAIAIAIKSKRLNAVKVKKHWYFTQEDWDKYHNSRYDRKHSVRNGRHIYDIETGVLSPSMIAKEYNVKIQQIYYIIRKNILPYERVGFAYVIKKNEFEKIHKLFLKNRKKTGKFADEPNSNDRNKKTKTLSKKSTKNNKRRLR